MAKRGSICTAPDPPGRNRQSPPRRFSWLRSASPAFKNRIPTDFMRVFSDFAAKVLRLLSANAPLLSGAPPGRMRRAIRHNPVYPVRPLGKKARKGPQKDQQRPKKDQKMRIECGLSRHEECGHVAPLPLLKSC